MIRTHVVPEKKHYRLSEVAKRWSALTGESIEVADVLDYACTRRGEKALIVCFFAYGLEITHEKSIFSDPDSFDPDIEEREHRRFPPSYNCMIRLPQRAINALIQDKSLELRSGVDDEEENMLVLAKAFIPYQQQLYVSAREMARWEEVEFKLAPNHFSVRYLREQLKEIGDQLAVVRAENKELHGRIKSGTPGYMDPEHKFFSAELFVAVSVWLAMHVDGKYDESKGGVIKLLETWIETEHSESIKSRAALTRISKVVNWRKRGGLTKTIQKD